MKTHGQRAETTRKKLLLAASEVFAHKGYRDATIAEMSKKAGVNIAAANYHFSDKETLYREAWRHSFFESIKAYPPDGGLSSDAPPEERLKGYIMSLIRRNSHKSNREFLIMQREVASPTGLLEEVVQEAIRPLHDKIESIVRELLGSRSSQKQSQFCAISIISQCTTPILVRRVALKRHAIKNAVPHIDDLKAYADHVVKFSLAGIYAVHNEI
jgi:AcrR family transcriptional regulator